jgi:leader peptidase (prepilin peptidase) / N-methyltransferase
MTAPGLSHTLAVTGVARGSRALRTEHAVAAGAAALGLAAALAAGRSPLGAAVTAGAFGALAAISLVDIRERRIPNAWSYPAFAGALLAAALRGPETLALGVTGAIAGGGYMLAFFVIGRGRLGFGDVKLATLGGALVGLAGVPAFLLGGTLLGTAVALLLLATGRGRSSTFPYGPALAAGAATVLLLRGPLAS